VSYYAWSRSTHTTVRVRDIVRGRVMRRTGAERPPAHRGLFLSVDGADEAVTGRYAELLRAAIHEHGLVPLTTAEPTDSAVGHRVTELMQGQHGSEDVEPETAALLSAADRAQHVATTIRPALERGEVVICDRYLLSSVAVHGGGHGADIDRIRSVNAWSTGDLLPDLTLVVVPDGTDEDPVSDILRDAVGTDPDRCVPCYDGDPAALPDIVITRLGRLLDTRRSVLSTRDSLL
jgi:dTMP kinase